MTYILTALVSLVSSICTFSEVIDNKILLVDGHPIWLQNSEIHLGYVWYGCRNLVHWCYEIFSKEFIIVTGAKSNEDLLLGRLRWVSILVNWITGLVVLQTSYIDRYQLGFISTIGLGGYGKQVGKFHPELYCDESLLKRWDTRT